MEKLFHEREGGRERERERKRERQRIGPISAMGGRGPANAALK